MEDGEGGLRRRKQNEKMMHKIPYALSRMPSTYPGIPMRLVRGKQQKRGRRRTTEPQLVIGRWGGTLCL